MRGECRRNPLPTYFGHGAYLGFSLSSILIYSHTTDFGKTLMIESSLVPHYEFNTYIFLFVWFSLVLF